MMARAASLRALIDGAPGIAAAFDRSLQKKGWLERIPAGVGLFIGRRARQRLLDVAMGNGRARGEASVSRAQGASLDSCMADPAAWTRSFPLCLIARVLSALGIGCLFASTGAGQIGLAHGGFVSIGDTGIDRDTAPAAGAPFHATLWSGRSVVTVPPAVRPSRLADLLSLGLARNVERVG